MIKYHAAIPRKAFASGNTSYAQMLPADHPDCLTLQASPAIIVTPFLVNPSHHNDVGLWSVNLQVEGARKMSSLAVVDALRRRETGIFHRRPTSLAFLLAHPAWVANPRPPKILSQMVTGQEPILLNMAEFHDAHDQSVIGSPSGYVGSDGARNDRSTPWHQIPTGSSSWMSSRRPTCRFSDCSSLHSIRVRFQVMAPP